MDQLYQQILDQHLANTRALGALVVINATIRNSLLALHHRPESVTRSREASPHAAHQNGTSDLAHAVDQVPSGDEAHGEYSLQPPPAAPSSLKRTFDLVGQDIEMDGRVSKRARAD